MDAISVDEDVEAKLRAGIRRRKIGIAVIFTVIGVGAMYPCVRVIFSVGEDVHAASVQRESYSQHATPAQVAAVREATARAEASLPTRAVAWRTGMANAATLGVDGSQRCPVELPRRQEASAERGPSIDVNYDDFTAIVFAGQHAFPYAVAHGGQLPSEPPRVQYARERIASMRERIVRTGRTEDFASLVDAARELSTPAFWTYDVVLFADVYVPPHADVGGVSFSSGSATGTAVLFDYTSGRPQCAGNVVASTTSTDVHYNTQLTQAGQTLQSMLDAEFGAQVERQIALGTRYGVASAITAE